MSIREKLSKFWNNVQYNLFPQLEQDLGELSPLSLPTTINQIF